VAALTEILDILHRHRREGAPADIPGYTLEAVKVLLLLGETEHSSGNIAGASAAYRNLMDLAKTLSGAPPSLTQEASLAHLGALRALGRIQLEQKQPEAALVLFREEIKIRGEAT